MGWGILLNFLIYVTLPVPLKYTGLLLGLGTLATYVSTIFGLVRKENFLYEQVTSTTYKLIDLREKLPSQEKEETTNKANLISAFDAKLFSTSSKDENDH